MPRGKSPDFRSLTLRIKLSMNPLYELMLKWIAAAATYLRRVGRQLLISAPVSPMHYGAMKMRLLSKDPWTPQQTDLSAPMGCLAKPRLPGHHRYLRHVLRGGKTEGLP
jgi:hypothetical protein